MATSEQRQQKVDLVTEALSNLAGIKPQSLARTTDLSPDINFKDAVPHFEDMLELCKQLNDRDLSRLTIQKLDDIGSACTTISNLITQVEDFNLNQNTPGDVCANLIIDISNTYDKVMNPLLLPLAFTATQATDYAKIEREAKGYLATMKVENEKLLTFMTNARTDAENALVAVKDQAAEAGVSTNAQIFLENSKEHGAVAKKWLAATIICGVVTFAAASAAFGMVFYYQPANTAAAVQYVVAKLIVLSTLSFGIFWSARNYKSQKHNETLNKHRANALMTFRTFVEGTSDTRVKDAILLQAAQAAFSGRPTGFDAPDKDAQKISPVVEILGKAAPHVTDGG